MVISIFGGLIFLLLLIGTPFKPIRLVGKAAVHVLIGAMFLYFLNAFGNSFDMHVPINLVTSVVSGVLGIPGVIALVIIQKYIV